MSAAVETFVKHVRWVNAKIEKAITEKPDPFDFTKKWSDGRTNSLEGEDVVADYLLNHPDLAGLLVKKDEDNRAFGDIGIDMSKFGWSKSVPCNIKIIAQKNRAGNNTCGLVPFIKHTFDRPCCSHEDAVKVLIDVDRKGYDAIVPNLYGFIMVQKETNKCWIGTFDEVPDDCILVNPSNGLQVPFLTSRVERTSAEYIQMIIRKIVEYHTKKAEPYRLWVEYKGGV